MTIRHEGLSDKERGLLLQLLNSGVSRTDLVSVLQSGTDDEWALLQSRHRDSSSPPRRGMDVILSGGVGKKRKFNDRWATIVRYPRSGAWMTVRPYSDQASAVDNHITWRKRGFHTVGRSCLLGLNDDVFVHIFGFLGHGIVDENDVYNRNGGMLLLKDAARLHFQIASVCRYLQKFCGRKLKDVLGHLCANFYELRTAAVVPCILWLCKYRLKLGLLKLRAEVADLGFLSQMLRDCDTFGVKHVEALLDAGHGSLSLRDYASNSTFITKAWMAKFDDKSGFAINLIGREAYPSLGKMATDLGIPIQETSRKTFHDTLARQCPNVTHLTVDSRINADEESHGVWKSHYFSRELFSLPKVHQMKLTIRFCVSTLVDGPVVSSSFIATFVENLPSLTELDVGFPTNPFSPYLADRRFHIESKSLRYLNVERLSKNMWVSCKCPNLRRFVCNGHMYGNGTRPRLSREQFLALQQRHDQQGDVNMLASSAEMVGMEIPLSCRSTLKPFWLGAQSFDGYQARLHEIEDAD